MHSTSVVKGLAMGLTVWVCLLLPQLGHAQDARSFRSWNFRDRYIRHRSLLGYVDRIVASDKLARQDATFRLVPGLAGKCNSFESVNLPGNFLRHENFRLKLAPKAGDQLFTMDATFCMKPGLASSDAQSFEAVNFPNHYIRHTNFELWLAKSDDSRLFREDATFFVELPLTEHSPPVKID